MAFKPVIYEAKREQLKASIMLEGLSGNGKSGIALAIARVLAGDWQKVGVVDTENRSLGLYVGLTLHTGEVVQPFKKIDLLDTDGYNPTHYIACINALLAQGATTVVQDSISHAWARTGGVLDQVTAAQERDKRLNNWTAWGDGTVQAEQNALFEMVRNGNAHVITTVRVEEKFELVDKKVNSLGEKQVQNKMLKYEPDLVLHMLAPGDSDGTAPRVRVVKSRYPFLRKDEEYMLTGEIIEQIRQYLEEGADPEELMKQQHAEYKQAVVEYIEEDPSAKATRQAIWKQLKSNAGHEHTKLEDMPLKDIKNLFMQLTAK